MLKNKSLLNENQTQQEILNQYLLMVEEARHISDRRTNTNFCFIAFHLICLSVALILGGFKACVFISVGLILCIVWLEILKKSKAVNSIKFEIITQLENSLSVNLFSYEWYLMQEKNKNFKLFFTIESKMPICFFVAYLFSFLVLTFFERN
ncbi:RipA family octameric membrane protein [Helicobacter cetorum]|uniref:Small integral membrane protein n=1 Tax=Helicobacter cetorum (strain ATCC BAA-540 / CCUG 52418 / MIT 99-5656) TaxID=1163745 RepID=I0EQK6_HELCM|nr:hypothetical protein [Helicobacter cetorum]AFI05225.1 hypothetical protein HCD_00965 [Helicobacter cetorum MIT 99-5656]